MIFRKFDLVDAVGIQLAHSLRLPGGNLRKGHLLEAKHIERLRHAGHEQVYGARLEPGDMDENQAACLAASILSGSGLIVQGAARGRCNIKAGAAGILVVPPGLIDTLNAYDEAITIATLAKYAAVRPGQVVATVKTIPFAVAADTLEYWQNCVKHSGSLAIAEFSEYKAALLLTTHPGMKESVLEKTVAVTRARLEALGSSLHVVRHCHHDTDSIESSLREISPSADLVLIAGASVSKDRSDTVPAGIVNAGGEVIHFGMPVEPGNMLLYARLGSKAVINLPGCARSRRANGFDWILQRQLAGLPIARADIMGMGEGGLISSGGEATGHKPTAKPATMAARSARVAAIILAAGRSRRMGKNNKLCAMVSGVPMVRRVVDTSLASRSVQTLVVTGYESESVEAQFEGCPVSVVHNSEFDLGMSSSLRAGLRALPSDIDAAIILLGDMPRITSGQIDCLIDAFDVVAPAIVAPTRHGRRGNPVLWPRRLFASLLQLQGDHGARSLIQADNLVTVEIDDDAIFTDIDTPRALLEADLIAQGE